MLSTMLLSWVAITTVVPISLIRSSRRMIPTEVVGSRFPVGSSARRIMGRLMKARAIETRCCSPPESSCGNRSILRDSPTSSRMAGTWRLMTWGPLPIASRAKATFSATVFFCSSL